VNRIVITAVRMIGAVLAIVAAWVTVAPAEPAPGPPDGPGSYSRRVWQTSEGLPEDYVHAFAQTPDGYLWIGTSGGLVRFDSVRFVVFNSGNEPAFQDDSIYTLRVARDGSLWAGTEGGGLVRYRGGSFRSFGAKDGLTNLFVRTVFEDRRGTLWVGTDRGLFRMEGESLVRFDGRNGVPAVSVASITEDRAGRLLVGGGGLLVLDGPKAVQYRSSGTLADNSIRTIREASDGTIWIGTVSGLRRLPGGIRGDPFVEPRLIDGTNVSYLWPGRRGEMWIGTYGEGLIRYDDRGVVRFSAPTTLPHDNVLAIIEDVEENVWIGTQGGMMRLKRGAASTLTTRDSAPRSINTIYEDPQGRLLIVSLNGRLLQVADGVLVPANLPGEVERLRIRNVFRDSHGRLWIGTDGQGVARIDGDGVVRLSMKDGLVNDFVRAFCEDAQGRIWIGTDGGLSYWQHGAFRNFSAESGLVYGSIRGLLVDRAGTLWVATERGVSRIGLPAAIADPKRDVLRGHKVWALHEDPDGGMWLGTRGAGLFLLKQERLSRFTTEHGLPSDKIHFIGEDRQRTLWLSGPSGVVAVSRRDLEASGNDRSRPVSLRVYGTTEGLSTSQMTGGVQSPGAITRSGEIWVASSRGAVRIVPEAPAERRPASVVIEQVTADDRSMTVAPAIAVPPGDGKLEIGYTSIRLGAPESIRFRYRMEGSDREWTYAGQRRAAYYTNLSPGRYRFHVAAYELGAPQTMTETVLDIHLQPHFHQTRAFLVLCGGVLLAAGWGVYRLHLRSLRREFAAVLDERNRVAREMHDTLIQGCIGVSTLLEAAANAQATSPALGADLLERARLEVRTAVEDARQAVWNLRRGASPGVRLIPAVLQLAHRVGLDAGIDVRVKTDGRPTNLDDSAERSLVLSIREALQNAIRHGAARHLSVHLQFGERHLRVDIVDDGRGFDLSQERAEADHHYGLVGMRERIERLGGEFHLTSAPGQGTTIALRVPLDASADRS
jgi:signal transduction histidine kinase/ligand-binding sensor domain-containing protein